METKTHELKTVAGNVFVIKDSITYAQHRELTKVWLQKNKEDSVLAEEADKMGMEFVIVSLNGSSEKIYETLSQLPFGDLAPVIEDVKSILNPKQ